MSTIQWFTLEYDTESRPHQAGEPAAAGCNDSERAQRGLGSVNFERTPQTHHYDWREVDRSMLRKQVRSQPERRAYISEEDALRVRNVDPRIATQLADLANEPMEKVQPDSVIGNETVAPE